MITASPPDVRLRRWAVAATLVALGLAPLLAGCGAPAPAFPKMPARTAPATRPPPPKERTAAGPASASANPPLAPWSVAEAPQKDPLRVLAMDGERQLGVIDHGASKVLWSMGEPSPLVALGKLDRAAFTPDGAWLATQRKLGEVHLWNVTERSGPLTLPVRPETRLVALLPGPVAVTQDAANEMPSPVHELDRSGRELRTFPCPPLRSVAPNGKHAVATPQLGKVVVVELPSCRELAAAPEGSAVSLVSWNPRGTDAALVEIVPNNESPYVQRVFRWHDGRISLVRDFYSTPLAAEWGGSFSVEDVVVSNDGQQIALTHVVHFDLRTCGMCRPQYYDSAEEYDEAVGGPRGEHDYLILDAATGTEVVLGDAYVSETSEFPGDARFFRPRHTHHEPHPFTPKTYFTQDLPPAVVTQGAAIRAFPVEAAAQGTPQHTP